MVSAAQSTQGIYQDILVNYLISMARTVESSVDRALSAILSSDLDRFARPKRDAEEHHHAAQRRRGNRLGRS